MNSEQYTLIAQSSRTNLIGTNREKFKKSITILGYIESFISISDIKYF